MEGETAGKGKLKRLGKHQNEPEKTQSTPHVSITDRLSFLSFVADMLNRGKDHPTEWPWRQYGTLNSWARLFADVQGWIPKTPINLTQQVAVGPTGEERAIAGFVNTLPSQLGNAVNAFIQEQAKLEADSAPG